MSTKRVRILGITAGLLLVALVITGENGMGFTSSHSSVEVAFSDPSKSGLRIVPASCPSAPLATTPDGGGYVLPPYRVGAQIQIHGYNFCISNSSGNTYFIPTRTAGEFSTFVANMGGAPGVYQRAPSSYPWYCWYGYNGAYAWYIAVYGGCS